MWKRKLQPEDQGGREQTAHWAEVRYMTGTVELLLLLITLVDGVLIFTGRWRWQPLNRPHYHHHHHHRQSAEVYREK